LESPALSAQEYAIGRDTRIDKERDTVTLGKLCAAARRQVSAEMHMLKRNAVWFITGYSKGLERGLADRTPP
jgi:hypothetical protein